MTGNNLSEKYSEKFQEEKRTHHKIRTNLNNLNDILNPHIKLRPAPEKKPKNKSVDNLSEREGVIVLEINCHSEI